MTVIVATRFKNKIVMGADTLVTEGPWEAGHVQKLWQVGDYVVGFCGGLGTCQGAMFHIRRSSLDPAAFLASIFEDGRSYPESEFLWAGNGQIITIDGEGGSVEHPGRTMALGSGRSDIMGFMAGAPKPRSLVSTKRLVEAAIKYTASADKTCGPGAMILVV